MSRAFRLAGILRLRRLEEDQAAARLAAAHGDLAETTGRIDDLARRLDASPDRAADAASLAAVAASRAATNALFAVLAAEEQVRAADVDQAGAELRRARAATSGLEKLQERHDAATLRAEGRAEQHVLDEVATVTWRTSGRRTGP